MSSSNHVKGRERLIRLPHRFYEDRSLVRAAPCPRVMASNDSYVWVDPQDPLLGEFWQDACWYAGGWVDCEVGLRSSARATRDAIRRKCPDLVDPHARRPR